MNGQPIDFVIPWVDDSDPAWQALRASYLDEDDAAGVRLTDARPSRYRDWGTLRYLLRGIDRFAPWARTVHFVTQGHLPDWLNTNNPRLNVVRHDEYIPEQYLPTFAANAIELNLHRLDSLSERFIYCNDDMLVLDELFPDDFFRKELPRLVASLEPSVVDRRSWFFMRVTNASVIDAHFSKRGVLRAHPLQWFNPKYPKATLKNLLMIPFGHFSGFRELHLPDPYLKSTLARVWDEEPELMDETCGHRFRKNTDPNIWLVQDWQMATGAFVPGTERIGKVFFIYDEKDARSAANYVRSQRGKLTCLNDHVSDEDDHALEVCRDLVIDALDSILPEPSSFEL